MTAPVDVRHEFSAVVAGSSIAAVVEFFYHHTDPHAVLLRAATVHGPHVWRVSRHTLRDGAKGREPSPASVDVACRVEPLGLSGRVRISLQPGHQPRLTFDMCGEQLLAALDDTAAVVPFDVEAATDWDGWLRAGAPR